MYLGPLRKAAIAHYEFERYVRQMIREEEVSIERGSGTECEGQPPNLGAASVRRRSTQHEQARGWQTGAETGLHRDGDHGQSLLVSARGV